MLSSAERAASAGLVHEAPGDLPILRQRRGRGFCYIDERTLQPCGASLRRRLTDLVVPPAWTDVRLARNPLSHIQAVGRDSEGRLQYIYHSLWTETGAAVKAERLMALGAGLPDLRSEIDRQLRRRAVDEPYALAAAIALLDRVGLRVGYPEYSRDDGGRGATTLTGKDVRIKDSTVRLRFYGKGGKRIERAFEDPALARALGRLKAETGGLIFSWREDGRVRSIDADAVNAALRQRLGDMTSARDFRTFRASALAAGHVRDIDGLSPAARKRLLNEAVRRASGYLANTPTVARTSYIHPAVQAIFTAEDTDTTRLFAGSTRRGLTRDETALLRILEGPG